MVDIFKLLGISYPLGDFLMIVKGYFVFRGVYAWIDVFDVSWKSGKLLFLLIVH